jgi:hypothetical protein
MPYLPIDWQNAELRKEVMVRTQQRGYPKFERGYPDIAFIREDVQNQGA